jgi:hypothetical protein
MAEAALNIRADAREISTAARLMRRFGVSGVRASRTIKREMRVLNREIRTLTQEQKLLTAEMLRVEKGSEAYKKLSKQLQGVRGALKEARNEAKTFESTTGRVAQRATSGARRGASYARVTAQQMVGTLGTVGPEQTYGTIGQFAGMLGTALSNVPYVGALFGLAGAAGQAGLNVMQRRSSMMISAQAARQQAGAFVTPGIGEEALIRVARDAAKQGFSPEAAFGIMRSFGQAAQTRVGAGVLPLQRMGFGPGAMGGAALYAAGMGGVAAGGDAAGRAEAGKTLLRQAAAQSRMEERILFGKGAERAITPTTVEQRLAEMVSYLKQMALEGVPIDPREFQNETMRVFGLGLQTQNRELFAGGRAFRFQTAMREGQRAEGGILNMMAIMSGMQRGQDVIGAMESARLGRVPLGQMQDIMQRMGVGRHRWMQYMIGRQIGRPMEEVAALAGGELAAPAGYAAMGGARGEFRGALGMFGKAAPVSTFQRELLTIRASEMEAAKGSTAVMIEMARQLVSVQSELAKAGAQAYNALVAIASGIHATLRGVVSALNALGITDIEVPVVDFSSMKLPGVGGGEGVTGRGGMVTVPLLGDIGGRLKRPAAKGIESKIKKAIGPTNIDPGRINPRFR